MDQRLIVNRWADAAPVHGADLQRALQLYGGECSEWLDLSAAVSPYSWWEERGTWPERNPFHHLPEQDPLLQQAMHQYYGQTGLLVAGSMQAIALLPQLFNRALVWVLAPSFAQHAFQWRLQGHEVVEKTATEIRAALSRGEAPDFLIWVNPNNPTATMLSNAELAEYAERLQQRGAWLVVDEAFVDTDPQRSLLTAALPQNLIVLRSLGKFFGLAGLRSGAVFANAALLQALRLRLGPWPVSELTVHVARLALLDSSWQHLQRRRLHELSAELTEACQQLGYRVLGSTALFVCLQVADGAQFQEQLARQKIWSRAFTEPNWIRLGLPERAQLPRLVHALKVIQEQS